MPLGTRAPSPVRDIWRSMFFNSMGLHVMDAVGCSPTSYSNLQSQDTPAGVISESHCRSSAAVRCTPVKFPQAHVVPLHNEHRHTLSNTAPAGAPLIVPHGGHSRETQSSQSYHRSLVKHPCRSSVFLVHTASISTLFWGVACFKLLGIPYLLNYLIMLF